MIRLLAATRPLHILALFAIVVPIIAFAFGPNSITRAQGDEDALTGDFTVSITDESVPRDIANGETVVGRWRVSFNDDGTYEAERLDLGTLVRGIFSAEGDTVTITDQEGLFSCSNAFMRGARIEDVATGTYQFELDSDGLTLTPDVDNCDLRRVLLSTTQLLPFVACTTDPLDLTAIGNQGDDPGAREGLSPGDVIAVDEASPTPEPVETKAPEDDPTATPQADDQPSASSDDEELTTEEQIDGLLSQMTACWATGEPERFLALWSEDFRNQFLGEATAIDSLRAAMQVPVGWERAGDVRMDGDDQAQAVVRTTTLDEEEFSRFLFVLEDGSWKWDGSAADE